MAVQRTMDTQWGLFFVKIPNFWASKFWGIWGIFEQHPFWFLVLWVSCPCFPLINHYFYKKLRLYIQIPNIYLGLGFEFPLCVRSPCVWACSMHAPLLHTVGDFSWMINLNRFIKPETPEQVRPARLGSDIKFSNLLSKSYWVHNS